MIQALYLVGWNVYGFMYFPWIGEQFCLVFVSGWLFLFLAVYGVISCAESITFAIRTAISARKNRTLPTVVKTNGLQQSPKHDGAQKNGKVATTTASDSSATQMEPEVNVEASQSQDHIRTLKVTWFLYEAIAAPSLVVSGIYFIILYPYIREYNANYKPTALDINMHGINAVLVLIELWWVPFQLRLLHVVYPIILCGVYALFSYVYWLSDPEGNVLYPDVLDWNHPEHSGAAVAVVACVIVPTVHTVLYCFKLIRSCMKNRT